MPHWFGKGQSTFCFRLVSLPGSPWSLHTAERFQRENSAGELGCHIGGTQGVSVCVWSGRSYRHFSLRWPIVSRPGLPKMEADLVSCLSPTLPSSSRAYSLLLFSPSTQASVPLIRYVGVPFTFLNARLSVFFLGQVLPRHTFWGLAHGVSFGQRGTARREQNPGCWRLLDRGQISFSLGDPKGSHS